MREFLSRHQIDYVMRNVFADPEAEAEWRALNVGVVPLAVLGERRLAIYHTDQLRGFLGLPPAEETFVYQELVSALDRVLEAVERAVLQVPAVHLSTPTPNRGRDLRQLVFNIHYPISLMQESLATGRFAWSTAEDFERSRHFATPLELAQFCRQTRLDWLDRAISVSPEEAAASVWTPRGDLSQLQLLEAQAWHASVHLRHIYAFLREIGITSVRELDPDQMRPIVLNERVTSLTMN